MGLKRVTWCIASSLNPLCELTDRKTPILMLCLNPIHYKVCLPLQNGAAHSYGLLPGSVVFELIYGSEHIEKEMVLLEEHSGPFLGLYFNLGDEFDLTVPDIDEKPVKFHKNHFSIGYLPGNLALFHVKKGAYASLKFNMVPSLARLWIHEFNFFDELIGSLEERAPFYLTNKPFFATDNLLRKVNDLLTDRHRGEVREMHFYMACTDIFIASLKHIATIHKGSAPKPALQPGNTEALERVDGYIKANLSSPITLDLIANEAGVEPRTLSRLFRRAYDQTVMQVVFEERMKEAMRLLLDTGFSIEQIANAVGYHHHTHFTTAFKRRFQQYPSEVRLGKELDQHDEK